MIWIGRRSARRQSSMIFVFDDQTFDRHITGVAALAQRVGGNPWSVGETRISAYLEASLRLGDGLGDKSNVGFTEAGSGRKV